MEEVFVYLYPIYEYFEMFISKMDKDASIQALKVLNETINERYRKKGIKVVFVMFPDKDIYGINVFSKDRVMNIELSFSDFIDINNPSGRLTLPSCDKVFDSLGNIASLTVGGFHFSSCVKSFGEEALKRGIDARVDLDLTDSFFNLYNTKYFNPLLFDFLAYKKYWMETSEINNKDINEQQFKLIYDSPIYH